MGKTLFKITSLYLSPLPLALHAMQIILAAHTLANAKLLRCPDFRGMCMCSLYLNLKTTY